MSDKFQLLTCGVEELDLLQGGGLLWYACDDEPIELLTTLVTTAEHHERHGVFQHPEGAWEDRYGHPHRYYIRIEE